MRSRYIKLDPMRLLTLLEVSGLSLEARGAYLVLLLRSYGGFGRYENGRPTKLNSGIIEHLLLAPKKQARRVLKELEASGLIEIGADQIIAVNGYDPAAWVRGAFPAAMREEILSANGNICALCGSTDELTIDHIIPVAAEGPESEENYQVLCRPCNSSKGTKHG